MQIKKLCFTVLILSAAASSAMAENFYAVIDAGNTTEKGICKNLPGAVTGCDNTSSLLRVGGGYQFSPNWGAEINYGSYGKASRGDGYGIGWWIPWFAGTSESWTLDGFQIVGTGAYPVADKFSLLGRVGVIRTTLVVDGAGYNFRSSTTRLTCGIGAQYDFNNRFAVRALYSDLGEAGSNETAKLKLKSYSVGVLYKF